jgi:outer membrane protein insertion porin family/translocation and assembly module TamA
MGRRLAHLALFAWPFTLASVLCGCPARLPEGATALDAIDVKGNDEIGDGDLLGAIASSPTSKLFGAVRLWWVDYGLYDETTLEKDLRRIERHYQARGYYEARVRAGRVLRTGDRSVRVQIVVEEGPLVTLERIEVNGIQELPADVRAKFVSAWKFGPGDPFDEELYRQSGAAAELVLTDEGYAYATLTLAADVDLVEHKAVVRVEVVPGLRCTFGKLDLEGLHEVAEDVTRRILMIEEGDRYSTRSMREAQTALFDLGAFDTIDFQPDLSDPTRSVVPVKISVAEGKLRDVRLGPGFLVDPLRNDLHVTGSWEHRNFFGGLRRFRVEVRPMLIFKPGFFSARSVRPGAFAATEIRQPGFLESRTWGILGANAGLIPDPVNDTPNEFRVLSATGSIGVDRRFFEIVYGGLFYRKAIQEPTPYADSTLPANVFAATLGYLELLASIDARDDVLATTKGYYASLGLQYAIAGAGFVGGDFGDVRINPEIRLYGPLRKGLVLAIRFATGFLLPFAGDGYSRPQPTDAPPLWRAFFSGGAVGNRGYPTRFVGQRDCAEGEVGIECSIVTGGASMWEGSIELRADLSGPLSAVLFMDASDVSRRLFDIRLDVPHISVGPGIRYATPVGPVRLDFGWRVPGLQRLGGNLAPEETPKDFSLGFRGPFALHLSIGESF